MAGITTYNGQELASDYYDHEINTTPPRGNALEGETAVAQAEVPRGIDAELWEYRQTKFQELAVCLEVQSAHDPSEVAVLEAELFLVDAQIMLQTQAEDISADHLGERTWMAMKIDELATMRSSVSDEEILRLHDEAQSLRKEIARANNIASLRSTKLEKILFGMEQAIEEMRANRDTKSDLGATSTRLALAA